jgi:hypothetical protein
MTRLFGHCEERCVQPSILLGIHCRCNAIGMQRKAEANTETGRTRAAIVATMPTDLPRPKRPPRNQNTQRARSRIIWEAIIAVAVAIALTEIIASVRFAFS